VNTKQDKEPVANQAITDCLTLGINTLGRLSTEKARSVSRDNFKDSQSASARRTNRPKTLTIERTVPVGNALFSFKNTASMEMVSFAFVIDSSPSWISGSSIERKDTMALAAEVSPSVEQRPKEQEKDIMPISNNAPFEVEKPSGNYHSKLHNCFHEVEYNNCLARVCMKLKVLKENCSTCFIQHKHLNLPRKYCTT
jgi:hypothetical protein